MSYKRFRAEVRRLVRDALRRGMTPNEIVYRCTSREQRILQLRLARCMCLPPRESLYLAPPLETLEARLEDAGMGWIADCLPSVEDLKTSIARSLQGAQDKTKYFPGLFP